MILGILIFGSALQTVRLTFSEVKQVVGRPAVGAPPFFVHEKSPARCELGLECVFRRVVIEPDNENSIPSVLVCLAQHALIVCLDGSCTRVGLVVLGR